jgi:hypothetical protein
VIQGDRRRGPGGYYDDRYRDRGTGTGSAIAVRAITAAASIERGAVDQKRDFYNARTIRRRFVLACCFVITF